jgi:predicted dehydrogenase
MPESLKQPVYTVAIVGLGRIGSLLDDPWADRTIRDESWRHRPCSHAGQIMAHPRLRLVAGADPNPDYRAAFERRWDTPAYADHTELLAHTTPDIVSICTRAVDRPSPTLDAVAAGAKALLLEKHLSASLAEADQMLAAVEGAGIPAVVNHSFRFDSGVRALADAVRAGKIGPLRSVVCYPGARLVHSGVHFFDLIRYFGAGEPVSVFGRLEADPETDDDPAGSGYVELDSGARAYIDARSRASHGYLELHGVGGVARVGNDASCTVQVWSLPPSRATVDAFYQPPLRDDGWRPSANDGDETGSIAFGRNINRLCLDEIVACLDDDRAPKSSIRDGLIAQEIATAIHHSHRLGGRLLPLPLTDRGLRLRAI